MLSALHFESDQIARLTGLIERHRLERFFDVGANFGLYSILVGRALPELRVDAFEPVDTTFQKLLGNMALNGLSSRIAPHQLALSDVEGPAEIIIRPESSGLSTLAADGETLSDGCIRQRVSCVRLDEIETLRGARLAFKIDVEHHELAVLTGMEQTLAGNLCVLQVESRRPQDAVVRAWFNARNYLWIGQIAEDAYFASAALYGR